MIKGLNVLQSSAPLKTLEHTGTTMRGGYFLDILKRPLQRGKIK